VRILANENFPGEAVDALRYRGHDVVWIRTDAPGSKDRAVLEWAEAEKKGTGYFLIKPKANILSLSH
jgi:hypothetical protein